jgi:hypothetical protein
VEAEVTSCPKTIALAFGSFANRKIRQRPKTTNIPFMAVSNPFFTASIY